MLNLGLLHNYLHTALLSGIAKYRIGGANSFVNYCPMRFIVIITSAKIEEYKKKKTLINLPVWPPSLSNFAGICTHVLCE